MSKGKIAVMIEEHFDETEFVKFNDCFPKMGYEVEYISNLWGQPSLTFHGNDHIATVTVTKCITAVSPKEYKALILIGGYAMDRLRYQTECSSGAHSNAPAVVFLREAVKEMENSLKICTICHSLWLFCADSSLLSGRKVTCAHNVICDVENAGGEVVYEGNGTKELVIDKNLITGKHPGMVDLFVNTIVDEIERIHH